MLCRSDLVSESKQNNNAGNAGDLLKHSAYLALLHELISRASWSEELSIVEAHSGKGVYAATSPNLRDAGALAGYRKSPLGIAQATAFADPPAGLGPIDGLDVGEMPYAGSAVLHALELSKLPRRELALMDHDASVRNTVALVFRQPALASFAPDLHLLDPGKCSEPKVLLALEQGEYTRTHVLHFDPFAFVMAPKYASTRNMYKRLLKQCDERVGCSQLAAATLFFTWGRRHNTAALADLYGAGFGGGLDGGYRDLVEGVDPSRRIVLTWCWGMHFSLLLIVPSELRAKLVARLIDYVEPFGPRMRRPFTVQ